MPVRSSRLVVHDRLTPNRLLAVDEVEACVRHIRSGGLVGMPTETGYMLAADAANLSAIDAVFVAKERAPNNPIHVAVHSLAAIERCVELPLAARRVCVMLMPGPITVVGANRNLVPEALVAHTGTLGVRIPDSPVALQVIEAFGGPVTATSLNPSGEKPPEDPREAVDKLEVPDDRLVHLIVAPGAVSYDRPSTLVTFVDPEWRVLREGPVSADVIRKVTETFTQDDVADWT
jgi:L-threonylcarbamoyladenylate synthase